jgi:hypothetical protein
MGTIKELNEEVGFIILSHIVKNKIEGGAIEILLEHVSRNSTDFVREYLKNILR